MPAKAGNARPGEPPSQNATCMGISGKVIRRRAGLLAAFNTPGACPTDSLIGWLGAELVLGDGQRVRPRLAPPKRTLCGSQAACPACKLAVEARQEGGGGRLEAPLRVLIKGGFLYWKIPPVPNATLASHVHAALLPSAPRDTPAASTLKLSASKATGAGLKCPARCRGPCSLAPAQHHCPAMSRGKPRHVTSSPIPSSCSAWPTGLCSIQINPSLRGQGASS